MLCYSRERIGYRFYDIERRQIIEERNVIFESIKGSYYLNKLKAKNNYNNWNIENLLNNINTVDIVDAEEDADFDQQNIDQQNIDYKNNINEHDIVHYDNLEFNANRGRDIKHRESR